jgi:hypothetical protein
MKKTSKSKNGDAGEILPEYNFLGKKGVRGKYYHAYRRGHTVRVYQEDGSAKVHYFTLADGAVMLEADVRRYFPDSKKVNRALRSLIKLIPSKPFKNIPRNSRQTD